jgi:hypothetical protein
VLSVSSVVNYLVLTVFNKANVIFISLVLSIADDYKWLFVRFRTILICNPDIITGS